MMTSAVGTCSLVQNISPDYRYQLSQTLLRRFCSETDLGHAGKVLGRSNMTGACLCLSELAVFARKVNERRENEGKEWYGRCQTKLQPPLWF